MKLLIAGSAKYLGNHITKQLLANNADFTVLAQNEKKGLLLILE